jgi:hypothetical protein
MISPKSKIRNVADTTSNKNRSKGCVIVLKRVSPINANNKTIAILIKLLATRIVANNFLGRSNSFAIICIVTDLFSIPSSILDFVRENKATSAPEIKAEHTSKTKRKRILVINDVLLTNTLESKTVGSGSKRK